MRGGAAVNPATVTRGVILQSTPRIIQQTAFHSRFVRRGPGVVRALCFHTRFSNIQEPATAVVEEPRPLLSQG